MRVNTINDLSYKTYNQQNTTPDPALPAPSVTPAIISLVGGPANIYMTTPAYEGMTAGDVITPVIGGGTGTPHTVLAEEAGQPITFSVPSDILATEGLAAGDQAPFAYMVEGVKYPGGAVSFPQNVRVVASIVNNLPAPSFLNTLYAGTPIAAVKQHARSDYFIYGNSMVFINGQFPSILIQSAYIYIVFGNNEYIYSEKISISKSQGDFVSETIALSTDKILAGSPKNWNVSIYYSINVDPGDTAPPAISQSLQLTMKQQAPAAAPEIIGQEVLDYYWAQSSAPPSAPSGTSNHPQACVYINVPAYPGMAFGDLLMVHGGSPYLDGCKDAFRTDIVITEDQVGKSILLPLFQMKDLFEADFKRNGSTFVAYYSVNTVNNMQYVSDLRIYNAPKNIEN